jgi:hypothetical protein
MNKKELPYHKNPGFKVPSGYFEDFEARLMVKAEALDEKGKARNQHGFKVPPGYFENFEARMLPRLEQENSKPKVIPLFRRKAVSYIAGVAAVFAVLLSSIVFNKAQRNDFNELDLMAVENYLLETIDFASPEDTDLINNAEFSFASQASPSLDQEAILEYLQENIEETAILLNE